MKALCFTAGVFNEHINNGTARGLLLDLPKYKKVKRGLFPVLVQEYYHSNLKKS